MSLAEWTGLEPATSGVTGRCSNQLSYHSLYIVIVIFKTPPNGPPRAVVKHIVFVITRA